MHVCVIGGGVVGLATAWQLSRQGIEVTLLEQNAEVGREATYANGCQLSYNYVAPLAVPGVLTKLPGWLIDPDSPLRFVPRWAPSFWQWCLKFAARCNDRAGRETTSALIALGRLSQREIRDFVAGVPANDFCYRENGKLVVYRDPAAFDAALEQMHFQASLGSKQQALDARSCLELEPALEHVAQRLCGGIYTPAESVADSHGFALALRRAADRQGVRFRVNAGVRALIADRGRITGARTDAGDVRADAFVVAAGIGSRSLLQGVGIRLPLMPLKGYSVTVPIDAGHLAPALSITDADNKLVLARLGDRLRVAGMVDLGDTTPAVVTRRVATLLRQVRAAFPRAGDYGRAETWAGLRPATPGGRPIVDRTAYANLWTNAGHGALGLTLAMGSAHVLSAMIAGRPPEIDPAPFRLAAA